MNDDHKSDQEAEYERLKAILSDMRARIEECATMREWTASEGFEGFVKALENKA